MLEPQRAAELIVQSLMHNATDENLAERRDRLEFEGTLDNVHEEELRKAVIKCIDKELERRGRKKP